MKYIIGIDGGGTKTEGVLTNLSGAILARRVTGASNPNDVTLAVSSERLHALCRDLLRDAGLSDKDLPLTSVFGGIAGGINHGPSLEKDLRQKMPAVGRLAIRSDIHILLTGELPTGDGACVICGTGSACFLRRGSEIIRIGGWGYLLDSGGSGYDIGRDALEAALRAFDGRCEATLLSELLAEHLGGAVHTRITEIYREGKPYIAACAPAVFRAAEAGDEVAFSILRRNARRLAEYVETAWRYLTANGSDADFLPVVMGGGISQKASPYWRDLVVSLVDPSVPAHITVAEMPPVYGAIVEGIKQTEEGGTPDLPTLRARFLNAYRKE